MLIPLFFAVIHTHGQMTVSALLEAGLSFGQVLFLFNSDTVRFRSIVGTNAYHDNREVASAMLDLEV